MDASCCCDCARSSARRFTKARNLAFGIICFSQGQQQVVHGNLVVGIFAQHRAALFDGFFVLAGLQIEIAEHVAGEREVRLELHRAGRRFHRVVEFRGANCGAALRNDFGFQIVKERVVGMRF